MAIKKLQNDFTTPEQSKRLIELGVPVWTANIMFDKNRGRYELIETEDESWAETQRTLLYNGGAIPHWSVGRLIEISELCYDSILPNSHEYYIKMKDCNTDYLIRMFELCANSMDFSKLENPVK